MNFFNVKTTWSNAEFIPLKFCIGTAYLLIGTYFHEFFQNYVVLIGVVFGTTLIWSVSRWLKKMKAENATEKRQKAY